MPARPVLPARLEIRHGHGGTAPQQRTEPFETWAPVAASWTPSTPAAARTGTRWESPWAGGSPRSSGAGCGRTSCSGSSCCRSRRRRRRSHSSPRSSPPTGRGTRGTGTSWWAPPTAAGSRSSTYVQRRGLVSICLSAAGVLCSCRWLRRLVSCFRRCGRLRADHPGQLQEGDPPVHPEGDGRRWSHPGRRRGGGGGRRRLLRRPHRQRLHGDRRAQRGRERRAARPHVPRAGHAAGRRVLHRLHLRRRAPELRLRVQHQRRGELTHHRRYCILNFHFHISQITSELTGLHAQLGSSGERRDRRGRHCPELRVPGPARSQEPRGCSART